MEHEKSFIELRYYSVEKDFPAMCLQGERWTQIYKKGGSLHFHNLTEIGYCEDGEGEMVFQNERIAFKKGTFTFIPKDVLHSTESSTPCTWSFIFVDSDLLIKEAVECLKGSDKKIKLQTLVIHEDDNEDLASVVRELLRKFKCSRPFCRLQIRSLLNFLLLESMMIEESIDSINFDKNHKEVVKALKYIDDNFEEDIKIFEIAKVCNMSEPYFRKIFKNSVGLSPLEHLNNVRIQKSCNMLKKSTQPIIDVALACGYTSVSTFNRNFIRFIGITPSEFRQNNKEKTDEQNNFLIQKHMGW